MLLRAPAGLDDFGTTPEERALKARFDALWNSNDPEHGFLGAYVNRDEDLPNYVDPRTEAPPSDPIAVPWNGFPKALSRWFDDTASETARTQAEVTADVLATLVYWVQPRSKGSREMRTWSCQRHELPFFAQKFGDQVTKLARPRRILEADGKLGAELVEQHRQQDEYLEWHAETDGNGKLVKLTFTAEPPDYWLALAQVSKTKVAKLYRDLVSSDVHDEDLFYGGDVYAAGIDSTGRTGWFATGEKKGDYNPLNAWTTSRGVMHLTHPANTLGAEVKLAKDASQVRDVDAAPPAHGERRPKSVASRAPGTAALTGPATR